jgi:hypothetical protein
MDQKGKPKSYGTIAAGRKKSQQTRPGAVWMIQPMKSGKERGHFVIGDRKAKAVIPKTAKP